MTNPPDTSPTLRRRHLLTGSVAATAAGLAGTPTAQAVPHSTPVAGRNISHGILQPHTGPIVGDIYLPSVTDGVPACMPGLALQRASRVGRSRPRSRFRRAREVPPVAFDLLLHTCASSTPSTVCWA